MDVHINKAGSGRGEGGGEEGGGERGEGEAGGCKDEVFSDSESQGPGGMVLDFRLRGMGGKAWMAAIKLSWQLDVTDSTSPHEIPFKFSPLPPLLGCMFRLRTKLSFSS